MPKPKKTESNVRIKEPLPHSFVAEKLALSCLIVRPELIERIISRFPIRVFYFKNHQELYKVLIYMFKKKLPIGILELSIFLEDQGLLKRVGGIGVLIELINLFPTVAYFDEYMQLINEKFLRRCLIEIGVKLINSGHITNISAENILKDLEKEVFSLSSHQGTNLKIFNSAELLETIFFEVKEKVLNPKLPGLPSGFINLDSITQGFQKSDLIILAGRPSLGKTALSLNITLNVIRKAKVPVLFFSLEMPKEQIMYRLLAMESNIDSKRLKTGELYKSDWTKLNKIIKILSKLPLFIDDSPYISVQDIRLKVKTIISEQKKLGLVIIDYLQLISNFEKSPGTRADEVSKITRSLKTIAREFDIPIISLSQLNRNIENRINQKPVLSDLRESGSLEQDADVVLMLSNPRAKDRNLENVLKTKDIELIIAKHRNGPTGSVRLKFNGKQMKFFEELKQNRPEPESNW